MVPAKKAKGQSPKHHTLARARPTSTGVTGGQTIMLSMEQEALCYKATKSREGKEGKPSPLPAPCHLPGCCSAARAVPGELVDLLYSQAAVLAAAQGKANQDAIIERGARPATLGP